MAEFSCLSGLEEPRMALKDRFERIGRDGVEFRGAPFWSWNDELDPKELRGEVTLVLEGATTPPNAAGSPRSEEEIETLIERLLEGGTSPRDAARQVAETAGMPRSRADRRVLARRKGR